MTVTIRLMHHSAAWRQEFQQIRSSVLFSAQGLVVGAEHIGSTAISGVIARPVIDLVAWVADHVELLEAAKWIVGLHFREVSSEAWCESDSIVLIKPRHGEVTHQIWLTHANSRTLQRTLRLRDYLRQHAERAIAFEEAKVRCWKAAGGAPDDYQRDKRLLFLHLEEQLGAWAVNRS